METVRIGTVCDAAHQLIAQTSAGPSPNTGMAASNVLYVFGSRESVASVPNGYELVYRVVQQA
jgi:hypothetical protein